MIKERYIAIDIGTNSIKYCIAEESIVSGVRIIEEGIEYTRLGEGLSLNNNLTRISMDRNLASLEKILRSARINNKANIFIVGTMALRTAENAQEFLRKIKISLGLDIEVISGEREAELTFKTIKSDIRTSEENVVIFDIGGGSTELIHATRNDIISVESVNAGAVRYTEKFLISDPVSESDYEKAIKAVDLELEEIEFPENLSVLIGIGGAVTTLGAIKQKLKEYDSRIIHGLTLNMSELNRIILSIKEKSINQRKKIPGLHPDRADVILAGAIIVKEIFIKSGLTRMIISDRGLRHGILLNRFSSVR